MLIALNQIELLYFEVELPSSAQPTSFFNFIVLSVSQFQSRALTLFHDSFHVLMLFKT